MSGVHCERIGIVHKDSVSLEANEEFPPTTEHRTCRICFEEGGPDLIAPCHCVGSVRWVHRHCLDQWRISGSNTRALGHCPQCGFAYLLILQRAPTAEHEFRQRRRRFLRKTAGHFLSTVLAVQLVLCTLAALLRGLDPEEKFVVFFDLPQVPGCPPIGQGSFQDAVYFHKSTYYLVALLLSLFLLGVGSSIAFCMQLCEPLRSGRRRDDGLACNGCIEGCCDECARADCDCDCQSQDCRCESESCGEVATAMIVVIIIVFIFVGVFVALVAIVVWAQKAAQRYFQIAALRELAGEYIVQDLSTPQSPPKRLDLIASAPTQQELQVQEMERIASAPGFQAGWIWAPVSSVEVQRSLQTDLQAVYGIDVPHARRAPRNFIDV